MSSAAKSDCSRSEVRAFELRSSGTNSGAAPRLLDIAQIALVCVLGYADFRFADCGWRKAYPKLDAFHQKMLERPSIKVSLPPAA